MICPCCGHAHSKVTKTNPLGSEIERLRSCLSCGHAWRTYEAPAPARPVRTRRSPPQPVTAGA